MGSLADLVNQSAKKQQESPASVTSQTDANVQKAEPAAPGTTSNSGGVDLSALARGSESKSSANLGESGPLPKKPSVPSTPAAPSPKIPLPGEIDIESIATQTGQLKEEEGLEAFLNNLREIPNLYDAPEILSAQIRSIMEDLMDHPHFIELVEDADIGLMVRGMRESLGVAQIKKSENKSKRGGNSKASQTKAALAATFEGLGGLDALSKMKI